jgi:sigma-B regulation protein RsbU (phosphoserine phosphatase)
MALTVEQAGLAIYNMRLQEEMLQRHRTEEQLKVARQIQMGLVPRQLPRIPGLSLAVDYAPAQEVGGDYYNFYPIDHDHLGVGVFDVSGKGVPGALLAAITGTFMKMAAPRSKSPAWALNEVSLALTPEIQRGMYVTACYAVLRLSTLQLTFVSAGHPDTLIIRERDANCERHKPRGAAIGLLPPNRFRAVLEQETVQLEQGDTVVFYTDGVTEAINAAGEHFGIDRLTAACSAHARKGPKEMTAEVLEAIRRHVGDTPQYDDITIIALRVWPEPDAATPLPGAPG